MRKLASPEDVVEVREQDLTLSIPIDPDVVYHVRAITVEKAREIVKMHTRTEFNNRTHRKEAIIDEEAVSNTMLDYAIKSWSNVVDSGVSAPCDLTHKLRLPSEVQIALIRLAQQGQVTPEAKDASFRQPA